MPIIAYQSFNANSSTNHGLASVSDQQFTREAKKRRIEAGDEVLQLPTGPDDLTMAIEGPAHLVPVDGSSQKLSTINLVAGQISAVWQNVYRVKNQNMPDIMVCGELDISHTDFQSVVRGALDIEASPQTRACQSFSRISQSKHGSQIKRLGFGAGYVVYSVLNLNVVFVHVPNSIAVKKGEVQIFYQSIATSLLAGGKIIHLVIGDTNQPSQGFTESALNEAFGITAYKNALVGSGIEATDIYQVKGTKKRPREGGTNSTATKMFDVAIYRSDVVKLVGEPIYLSQASTGQTATDHCGVVVEIEPT